MQRASSSVASTFWPSRAALFTSTIERLQRTIEHRRAVPVETADARSHRPGRLQIKFATYLQLIGQVSPSALSTPVKLYRSGPILKLIGIASQPAHDRGARDHELPPRLPRRQFRRRRQACGAGRASSCILRAKPAAFRVIDTHAGAGLYDLAGPEASRSRRMARGHSPAVHHARSPSRRARCSRPISMSSPRSIRAGALVAYPGSPALVRALLRPQDRLVACELEPNAAAALARSLARRPPRQGDRDRRLDRAQRLCAAEGAARPRADRSAVRGGGRLRAARATRSRPRTANGRAAPICSGIRSRSAKLPTRWRGACGVRAFAKILRAEIERRRRRATSSRLGACGLIVVNPPWTLERELAVLLPALAATLSGDRTAPLRSIGSPAKS